MNKTETMAIMAVLKTAYPQYYRTATPEDADAAVKLWTEMFQNEPGELVAAAVKALIASDEKGFPPHIGAVKAKIRQLFEPTRMSETEAWALVRDAVTHTDYYAPAKQFDRLPELIQRCLGSPRTLVEWGKIDEKDFSTVTQSNFMRTFRAKQQFEREYAAIPDEVKAFVSGMEGAMFLGTEPESRMLEESADGGTYVGQSI